MRASLNGVTLAESDETIVVEGNHYFPPGSVDWEHLQERQLRSLCIWKGVARYYDAEIGGEVVKGPAWTYHHPYPWIRKIRNHVAFWGPVEVGGGPA
jgi:uncharacterized protein (DUF427 family)